MTLLQGKLRSTRLDLFLLVVVSAFWMPLKAQTGSSSRLLGQWEWRGEIGWQRLTLVLKEERGKLTGTIKMGPGPGESTKPEDYWEYFFTPGVFEISNGFVRGDTISFEQIAIAAEENNVSPTGISDSELKFIYTGKQDGDDLVLKREFHGGRLFQLSSQNQSFEIVMTRAGAPPNRAKPISSGPYSIPLPTSAVMDVTVKGPDGKFVTSLRKEDFQVIDDGGTQEIQSVMPPITPWNIVFLLDLDALLLLPDSYSGDPAFAVRGAERAEETWRQIGDGVAAFYRSLRSQDRFAIDLFVDDRTAQMLPWRNGGQTGVWTASRPDLRPVSQSGAPPEKNLYRAIRTALERLRGTKGHQVVVLLTDGRDGRLNGAWLRTRKMVSLIDPFYGLPNSDEQQEFEQLLAAVKKSGIRFFIASVNGDRSYHQGQNSAWAWTSMGLVPEAAQNFSSLHQAADERLSRLARTSGGAIFSRGKNPDAAVAIARLAERLSLDRTYRITYSRSVHEATEHGVEVILQNPRLQVEQLLSDRFWSLQ